MGGGHQSHYHFIIFDFYSSLCPRVLGTTYIRHNQTRFVIEFEASDPVRIYIVHLYYFEFFGWPLYICERALTIPAWLASPLTIG